MTKKDVLMVFRPFNGAWIMIQLMSICAGLMIKTAKFDPRWNVFLSENDVLILKYRHGEIQGIKPED